LQGGGILKKDCISAKKHNKKWGQIIELSYYVIIEKDIKNLRITNFNKEDSLIKRHFHKRIEKNYNGK